jgi:rare lipoprotein A
MKISSFFNKGILFLSLFILLVTHAYAQDSTNIVTIEGALTDTTALQKEKVENSNQKTLIGKASYYAAKFEGRKTANGEIFRHKNLTAACNVLPLGTWIEVTNLSNNKKVIVKTNDRLAPHMTRVVDLTLAAAKKLDFVNAGLTKVKVVVLGKNYKKQVINK